MFLIVFVLNQSDVGAANLANNSIPLSILHLSFPLDAILIPFLNLSEQFNHFVVLADSGQALLEHFKVGLFAPLHSLESVLLAQAPVALRLWRDKQFDDFLLQGSPLRRLLLSRGGAVLLGLSRPTLRGAEEKLESFFDAVSSLYQLLQKSRVGVLFVRSEVLNFDKLLIGSV